MFFFFEFDHFLPHATFSILHDEWLQCKTLFAFFAASCAIL
ncbi:hypothetical protein EVA_09194 [gut metagenome]|uniref:Uncharacterized protein n=1 Tax=gut metagenome TaxID=749906 RepID=J9G749_9ZZZZ